MGCALRDSRKQPRPATAQLSRLARRLSPTHIVTRIAASSESDDRECPFFVWTGSSIHPRNHETGWQFPALTRFGGAKWRIYGKPTPAGGFSGNALIVSR